MRFVKRGGSVADLSPHQRDLFRAYNRENQRKVKARARQRREEDKSCRLAETNSTL
jgi:antitoxin (DNA-binding transcriptional repressor) of toxin-antitoxin stability system